ncbi:hypothetical protein [Carboxylicivirga marina]|uniref:Phosphatidate cytidylyltransferase n=1 Tax=Carboxylicivirga marina TaxID=2800988 RepID=A0ABS1HHK3_9BACT|nr:hypothetical protein [Carboxylicivirga marina]MBK3516679.1 hypothetical protein [Carboxylicivirga marina]
MKTVNYVIASAFALLALGCAITLFFGAHHNAILFPLCAIGALMFFLEARKDEQ